MSDVAGRANRAREAFEEQGGLDPLIEEDDDDEGLWGGPRNGGHSGRGQHDFIDEMDDDLDDDEHFDNSGEPDESDDYGTVGDEY